ncbi:PHD-finger family protein [Histomonas meleagridis]|uniref:PHD-finger family protein n=1 Tax=Histomonas meleagridis TaxID=135588 RepID=UPI00355969F9|nr:PHD-finger family protein [Histomonas meleagridis]KAH0796939.1 PHD-finger family protein [Histomonas meleagridis]
MDILGETFDNTSLLSPFELKALAFANLIENVSSGQKSTRPENIPNDNQEIPLYTTIRCICGSNENSGKLVVCSCCHCRLHANCLDSVALRNPNNFKCPFCLLQNDGVDPFRELTLWIDEIDSELRDIHGLVQDASGIEDQINELTKHFAIQHDYQYQIMRSQNNYRQLSNALSHKMQEILQHITKLTYS